MAIVILVCTWKCSFYWLADLSRFTCVGQFQMERYHNPCKNWLVRLYSLGTGHKQPNICTVWVCIAHPHFLNCIFAFSRFIISKPLEQLVVSGRKTWHEIVHVQISLLIVPSLCASATLRNGIVDSQGMHGHFYLEKLWNSKTSLCFFHPDNLFLSVNQKSPDVFVSYV